MNPGLNPAFRRPARRTRTPLPGFSFGNALQFDGINDRAEVNVGAGEGLLPPIGRNGSFAAWVYPTKTASNGFFVWGDTLARLAFATNNGNVFFWDVNGTLLVTTVTPTLAAWQHLVVTWADTGTVVVSNVYVNAVFCTGISSVAWPTAATKFVLGNNTVTGGNRPFGGRMDEVTLYDRALSVREVQTLYGAGIGPSYQPTQGLLGRWAFDETGGTTAPDSSGNGRHLTLVNGPTFVPHY